MQEKWKIDKNRRAIAILRVSSIGQRENTSHETQERSVDDYSQHHNLTVVKKFRISESAKNSTDRKQYRAAIDFALSQGIRHLLFYMQDREARNMRDLEENEELVKQDKLIIHYIHDNKVITKDTPDSDFLTRDFQGVELCTNVVDDLRLGGAFFSYSIDKNKSRINDIC